MSHVSRGGALRTSLAGLRAGLLRGRGRPHVRLRALRTRVFREVGEILGGHPSAPRDPRLPRRLSLLRHTTQSDSGLFQTDLPGPRGLILLRVLLRQRGGDWDANML